DHAPAWIVLRDGGTMRRTPSANPKAASVSHQRADTAAKRNARAAVREVEKRPLLVIDGDSFAHRAYHGVPKTIQRRGGKPAGAIVGFANFLLRLYQSERPRAVLVGWDTLTTP